MKLDLQAPNHGAKEAYRSNSLSEVQEMLSPDSQVKLEEQLAKFSGSFRDKLVNRHGEMQLWRSPVWVWNALRSMPQDSKEFITHILDFEKESYSQFCTAYLVHLSRENPQMFREFAGVCMAALKSGGYPAFSVAFVDLMAVAVVQNPITTEAGFTFNASSLRREHDSADFSIRNPVGSSVHYEGEREASRAERKLNVQKSLAASFIKQYVDEMYYEVFGTGEKGSPSKIGLWVFYEELMKNTAFWDEWLARWEDITAEAVLTLGLLIEEYNKEWALAVFEF